ncbi:MAG: Bax inhibitor-1/YccA family protein, partial [Stenotrophomonas maltophilia]
TVFKKEWSPVTAPMYALVEGLFLGAISAMFNAKFPGIVMQAVMLTFGTLFVMLAVYRSGLIKVTENFKLGVVAATGGIALLYLASFVLSFFNINVPMIHE